MPMDSRSHTNVARCLLDYIEQNQRVEFNRKAFYFGNLKPDLKGEYFNRNQRHYPSLMFDDVMDKIRDFVAQFTIEESGTRRFCEALGEICHYITDFFCYPHNDTIYEHGLLAHYIYEKRQGIRIKTHVNSEKFQDLADGSCETVSCDTEALVSEIKEKHAAYTEQKKHNISDDVHHICAILVTLVSSIIHILRTPAGTAAPEFA